MHLHAATTVDGRDRKQLELPAAAARRTAVELEQIHNLFEDIAFPYETKPEGRTAVLVLRDREELQALADLGNGGGFFRSRTRDPSDPQIFLYGELSLATRGTLQHELAHRFIHFYFPNAPAWVHEGLAQYYSTMTVEDGRVILGRDMPDRRLRLGHAWGFARSPAYGIIVGVPTGELPGARALVEGGPGDFHRRTAERSFDDEDAKRVTLGYTGAWSLVHVLKNMDKRLAVRFDYYMLALGGGTDPREAWNHQFGVDGFAELDGLLQAFYKRRETTLLRAPYELRAVPDPAERTMRPDEVHLLWAATRPWTTEALPQIRVDIGAAVAIAPSSLDAKLWQARLALHEGRIGEGERLLAALLAAHPDDERCLKERFSLAVRRTESSPSTETFARADAAAAALQKHASAAYSLNNLAWYLAHRGRLDEALPLALRSVNVDFACFECFDTLAFVLHEKGSLGEADAMQTIAVNLVPHGFFDPEMLARQRQYRLDARAARSDAR